MGHVNTKIFSDRESPTIFLLFAMFLLMPPPVAAIEVSGVITVEMEGDEVMPGVATPVPLKNAKVHLGLLEAPTIYSYLDTEWSTQTDANGRYSIFVAPDDDPIVPSYTITYALTMILESGDLMVAVYDNERDPGDVACLSTPSIDVANRGVTQADINLKVRADNNGDYTLQGSSFQPVEDLQSSFAGETRCTEPVLASPAAIGVLLPYDPNGLTNSHPERFAHLAVNYARTYNAFEFVRDGLGKTGVPAVRINGWDSMPGWAYSCEGNAILIDADNSMAFGPNAPSAVFNIRHEYGHHYMCGSSIGGSGDLPPLAAGDENHDGLANDSSADSWVEGFATYFAAAAAQHNGEQKPQEVMSSAGPLDLQVGGARLDDPATAGQQLTFGWLGEEFAIASLMWQLSVTTGHKALLDSLETPAVSDPVDFHLVYVDLKADSNITTMFNQSSCDFPQTSVPINGIDCLFISEGFYHDLNGDGFYGDGEEVGRTRWWLSVRGPDVFRPHVPPLEGSLLRLSAVDQTTQSVDVDGFKIEIEYDAPLAQHGTAYTRAVSGNAPWEFGILVPGEPSRAIVSPIKTGFVADAPLVIESAFFHDHINPFGSGGVQPVPPVLAEYTFTLRAATTEGPVGDPTCEDALDNDGDGLTDGNDPDCQAAPDLAEAIQCLQIVAGFDNVQLSKTDVNGDGVIGVVEAIHSLQSAAEMR